MQAGYQVNRADEGGVGLSTKSFGFPHSRCRYGLAWSKVKSGHILSASEDTSVAHW